MLLNAPCIPAFAVAEKTDYRTKPNYNLPNALDVIHRHGLLYKSTKYPAGKVSSLWRSPLLMFPTVRRSSPRKQVQFQKRRVIM